MWTPAGSGELAEHSDEQIPPLLGRGLPERSHQGPLAGSPARCVKSCQSVTAWKSGWSLGATLGKTWRIVVSLDSLPSSIRVPIMVAVIALVHDPRCIWSVTRIGSGEPILRIPIAPITASRLPMRIAPINPGRWCSSRTGASIWLTRSSACDRRRGQSWFSFFRDLLSGQTPSRTRLPARAPPPQAEHRDA